MNKKRFLSLFLALMMVLALHMAPMVERHQTDLEEHSQKQMKAKLKYQEHPLLHYMHQHLVLNSRVKEPEQEQEQELYQELESEM